MASKEATQLNVEATTEVSTDKFFQDLCNSLTESLQGEYRKRLHAEREELRRRYDQEIHRVQQYYAQSFQCLGPDSPNVAIVAESSVAGEAAALKGELAKVRDAVRRSLDVGGPLPFEPATALLLKEAIEDCKKIQSYVQDCLERLTLELSFQTLDGKVLTADVCPAVDTCLVAKRKLAEKHGMPSWSIKLASQGDSVVMRNQDSLLDFDLSSGVTMMRVQSALPNMILKLPFDNVDDLAHEAVSGRSGEFQNKGQTMCFERHGRTGINFTGRSVLRFAEEVNLGDEYTISCWTHVPMPNDWPHQYWRDLLDGPDEWRLPIALLQNRMGLAGNRHGDHHLTYDLSTLPDGWHHIAAVGAEGYTRYFVDGEMVGQLAHQYTGRIGSCGNRYDAEVNEAFGVVSDLQIFATAANEDEIRGLFGA